MLCCGVSLCSVVVQRFLCWLHTTPTILVLVKMMATNITRQQVRQTHNYSLLTHCPRRVC